ncbi:MAG: hypothetical protein EOO45_00285 [Flavobacterium sp.]|nr:MAG: hypothetical protein EOO45_00285 [Flavobacterium sp.]
MKKEISYFDLIEERGRSMSEINPGSVEKALTFEDALIAIELLKNVNKPIYGGDIVSENDGKLMYAYNLWGSGYHCLNWSCDKEIKETNDEFINRSYETAKKSVVAAKEIANKIFKNCYIVLVL